MSKTILAFLISIILFAFIFRILGRIIRFFHGSNSPKQTRSYSDKQNSDNLHKKYFSKEEGEYVDYVEIKDDKKE